MIINRIHETQNLLSLLLVSFLVGLRTYQHPCKDALDRTVRLNATFGITEVNAFVVYQPFTDGNKATVILYPMLSNFRRSTNFFGKFADFTRLFW